MTYGTLIEWLKQYLMAKVKMRDSEFDPRRSFSEYGLDSKDALEMIGDIGSLVGHSVNPSLLYDCSTIGRFARAALEEATDISAETVAQSTEEPIAIIGMACRFPRCEAGLDAFWKLLCDGGNAIRSLKEVSRPPTALKQDQRAAWLDNIDRFDAAFFSIAPREATAIDPQQRMLLEASWNCFEDALVDPAKLAGSNTGVFIGISTNDYRSHLPPTVDASSIAGNALSVAANRISYFYDFIGPSVAIDTACSSSLTAVHLACRALQNGEAGLALAGGANIILTEQVSEAFRQAGMLAPDAQCKTFDDRADGYVRGEGIGVVLLKPLTRAVADGNKIYAVLLGSSVVQDGRTNGLMAPNGRSQRRAIRQACVRAGVRPNQIDFVEAHGTGTYLGDLVELSALQETVGRERITGKCRIGSVKTNIGHLEAAAGIAGLIKTALCLYHSKLVPSLNYGHPNRRANLEDANLEVQSVLEDWPKHSNRIQNDRGWFGDLYADTAAQYAGVSSFGFGGTNVHVVLASPPIMEKGLDTYPPILPISAQSHRAFAALASSYLEKLRSASETECTEICSGLRTGRHAFRIRAAISCADHSRMLDELENLSQGKTKPAKDFPQDDPGPVFVFSGQGDQWTGMGRDLFSTDEVFRRELLFYNDAILERAGWSLIEVLFDENSADRLHDTTIVQPTLFAIQCALAETLITFNVIPKAVIGHSVGEYAAFSVAGILEKDEALRLILLRSGLMGKRADRGAMLAINGVSRSDIIALIGESELRIDIAAHNSEQSIVVSGTETSISKFKTVLSRRKIPNRSISSTYGFHSGLFAAAAANYANASGKVDFRSTGVAVYSSVTGRRFSGPFSSDFLRASVAEPVEFYGAMRAALRDGHRTFIEVGPHPSLVRHIENICRAEGHRAFAYSTLRRDHSDSMELAKSLGDLYEAGLDLDWGRGRKGMWQDRSLPLYPWKDDRFWSDFRTMPLGPSEERFVDHTIFVAGEQRKISEGQIAKERHKFLKDHVVDDRVLVPAAAIIEIFLEALEGSATDFSLCDLQLFEAIDLASELTSIQIVQQLDENSTRLELFVSHGDDAWRLVASARAVRRDVRADQNTLDIDSLHDSCVEYLSGEGLYQRLHRMGYIYGESLRLVSQVWASDKEVVGVLTSTEGRASDFIVDPLLLDAGFHLAAMFAPARSDKEWIALPTALESATIHRTPVGRISAIMRLAGRSAGSLTVDLDMLDDAGPYIELRGLHLNATARSGAATKLSSEILSYVSSWKAWPVPKRSTPLGGRWLVFADNRGLGAQVVKFLKDSSVDATIVFQAASFRRASSDVYYIREDVSDDVDRLLSGVGGEGKPIAGIVYCWLLDEPLSSRSGASDVNGVTFFATLVHSIVEYGRGSSPHIHVVTESAQAVTPGDVHNPNQSSIWGFTKAIPFEHPNIRCTRIDLDDANKVADVGALLSLVGLQENEDQFAIRNGIAYVARLKQVPFIHTMADRVPLDGTCVITGGNGALGVACMRAAVAGGFSKIALLSRSGEVRFSDDILRELSSSASVHIYACDLADRTSLSQTIQKVELELGPIVGLMHLAGVLDDGAILKLSRERIARVMNPKVTGLFNLIDEVDLSKLRSMILFSSAASILGSPGQASYMAANAVLDAAAHYLRSKGIMATSINWGPWSDAGMAEGMIKSNARASELAKAIAPELGQQITVAVMKSSEAQLMIVPFDIKPLVQFYPSMRGVEYFEEIMADDMHFIRSDGGHEAVYARPELDTPYVAPSNDLEALITDLWGRALGMTGIGIHDEFFALGGDSVFASQIVSELVETFEIELDTDKAFDKFTIANLAALVEDAVAKQLAKPSSHET